MKIIVEKKKLKLKLQKLQKKIAIVKNRDTYRGKSIAIYRCIDESCHPYQSPGDAAIILLQFIIVRQMATRLHTSCKNAINRVTVYTGYTDSHSSKPYMVVK